MNMSSMAQLVDARFHSRARRALWLALTGGMLLLMILAAPRRYAMLRDDAYGFGATMPALGLSFPAFAAYFTTLEIVTALTLLTVATLVAWRRVSSWTTLLFAGTLAAFGFLMPLFDGLTATNGAWEMPLVLLRVLVSTGFFAMLCVFPDGRFVPGWSRWYLLAWAIFVLLLARPLSGFLAGTAIIPQTRTLERGLALLNVAAWTLTGLSFQVYRYRVHAGPEQRRRTRWVVLGLLLVALVTLANALLLTLVPALREDPRSNLIFTLSMGSLLLLGAIAMALTVAVAVLRHQLWDIDILLNRTLVYGGLTALITGAYVLLVGGAGMLSRGNAGYVAGAALATALLVLLWRPVAGGWQTAVDRLVPAGAVPSTPADLPAATAAPRGLPLRAAWWGVTLLAATLLAAGLLAFRARGLGWFTLLAAWPGGGPALLQPFLRLDPPLARALLLGSLLHALVSAGGGLFLYARRPREPLAVLASLMLITVGLGFTPPIVLLPVLDPGWKVVATLFQGLMFGSIVLFLYLFPNGRFTPAWTRSAAILWALYAVSWLLWPGLNPHRSAAPGPVLVWACWVGSGLLAQVQRYRGPATPTEKQQAKWVIAGFVAANLGLILISAGELAGGGSGPLARGRTALLGLGTLLIPLTIAIALLRYRLWDIDLYINRTLVYGGLTALILAAYVLLVGGLSALFQSQNELLLSLLVTGLIAVLFQPLRAHLQRGVNRLMFGERDNPYGLLADLGRQLGEAGLPEENLAAITRSLCAQLKLPYAAIELAAGDGRQRVAACGSPLPGEEWPLLHRGEVVGWLVAAPRPPEKAFGDKDRRLLATIAAQAGATAYALRLTAALQRSREQLVLAREEERRRLRRDLHDGLGPALASQNFALDAALETLEEDPVAARAILQGLMGRNGELVADIRRLVHALRPPALDQLGLHGALAAYVHGHFQGAAPQVALDVSPQPLPEQSAAVEVAAYFIVREALANVQRHAHAAHCWIELRATEQALTVRVADDGRGLTAGQPAGVGLLSMRERAEELGGTFTCAPRPGGGALLTAVLPTSGAAAP